MHMLIHTLTIDIHTYLQFTTSAAMFVDKEEGMLYSVSPQQVCTHAMFVHMCF